VVSIGKEACILIRMSWTGNNTFILGGAQRRKREAGSAGRTFDLDLEESMIHRMHYSAISR
jgi:hypothetical protein